MDWKKKLTSRKMWLAIAEFISMLIVAMGKPESTATQVTALIMAGAGVIGYIIGEGLVDAARTDAEMDAQLDAENSISEEKSESEK